MRWSWFVQSKCVFCSFLSFIVSLTLVVQCILRNSNKLDNYFPAENATSVQINNIIKTCGCCEGGFSVEQAPDQQYWNRRGGCDHISSDLIGSRWNNHKAILSFSSRNSGHHFSFETFCFQVSNRVPSSGSRVATASNPSQIFSNDIYDSSPNEFSLLSHKCSEKQRMNFTRASEWRFCVFSSWRESVCDEQIV